MVDSKGTVLANTIAGPANIRLSIETACQSIHDAFVLALKQAKISSQDLKKYSFQAGMGLAGCEVKNAHEDFLNQLNNKETKQKLPFDNVTLQSDAYIACVGAHGGKNGSVIIAGTGVVGLKLIDGKKHQIGGWGFPHGDEGAGAWLGLEAIKGVMHMMDGLQEPSPLLLVLKKKLGTKKENLTQWACNASATEYASLTPIIVKYAQKGEIYSVTLLKRAARYIENILILFLEENELKNKLPCSLIGGMAPILMPYIKKELIKKLSPPLFDACQGALLIASKQNN